MVKKEPKRTVRTVVQESCPTHKPYDISYQAFHEDALERTERGEVQKQCPKCGFWFWADEY